MTATSEAGALTVQVRPAGSVPVVAPAVKRLPSVKSGFATTVPPTPLRIAAAYTFPVMGDTPPSRIPTVATALPDHSEVVPAVVTVAPNWTQVTAVWSWVSSVAV